jgi:LytR cell envelope-related transcriptional attenuator
MHIIEQIGSYAGLAAVVGLAVLAALYFSQARDVKRLREWAGRAPERAAEQVAVQRGAPQPGTAPAQGAAAPKPAGAPAAQPAPAHAAATGATPATAKPAAATPAAQSKQATPAPAPAGAGTESDDTKPPEVAPKPAPATAGATAAAAAAGGAPSGQASSGAPQASGTTTEAPPKTGGDGAPPSTDTGETPAPETPAPAVPGGPGDRPPVRRFPTRPIPAPRPGPSQTAILPPYGQDRPWYRRLLASPRYLVLAIAGILIVGGGAAFGVVQLTKEESPSPKQEQVAGGGESGDSGGGKAKKRKRAPAVHPADVTVSVLNGTTVPGLAAQIGDKVESFGFQLGNVTNSSDQQRAESVVLYGAGHQREAVAVGRKLRIGQREAIDPQSQALGGDASVVVVAGADETQ